MINSEKAFVQNQIIGLIVSNMVNVELWEILLRCPKCGIENEATLGQIKRGENIQCITCATKISLKDENGRVAKVTKQVQDVMESLEEMVEKIGGSLKLK
jgi:DNA-directed RNA polymerase subunit RPC12/RpoP